MKPAKLLARLAAGSLANVRYTDLVRLAEALGFQLKRISGSHHIFAHPDVLEQINLQDVGGQAKPYQIRQLLRLVERYDLRLEARQ